MSIDEAPTTAISDADREMAAPARRRLRTPSTRTVLASLILVAAGFSGGVLEARHQGVTSTSSAVRAPTTGNTTTRTATGTSTAAGGSTFGTVKIVDGDTIYLTTADGSVVKVTTSKSTKLQVSSAGSASDLATGATVVVQGTTDASGNLTATSISQSSTGAAGSTPAG
jgi:hypothetical protein